MGHVFIKTSPVKQYSHQNDFSGVLGALHQSFLVMFLIQSLFNMLDEFYTTFGAKKDFFIVNPLIVQHAWETVNLYAVGNAIENQFDLKRCII